MRSLISILSPGVPCVKNIWTLRMYVQQHNHPSLRSGIFKISYPPNNATNNLDMSPHFWQIKELKNAIENDFFFEMYIDDLPMWGYLGEVHMILHHFVQWIDALILNKNNGDFPLLSQVVHEEFLLGKSIQEAKVYLYPHLHFVLGYNNDQVMGATRVSSLC